MLFPIVSERFFRAFTPFGYVFDRPVMVSAIPKALLTADAVLQTAESRNLPYCAKLTGGNVTPSG